MVNHLTAKSKAVLILLYQNNSLLRQIAKQTVCPLMSVQTTSNNWKKTGSEKEQSRSGQPKRPLTQSHRAFIRLSLADRRKTSPQLCKGWKVSTAGVDVILHTV